MEKEGQLAKAMITQCVKADLVIKVAHAKHAKESWTCLRPSTAKPAQDQLCYGSGD